MAKELPNFIFIHPQITLAYAAESAIRSPTEEWGEKRARTCADLSRHERTLKEELVPRINAYATRMNHYRSQILLIKIDEVNYWLDQALTCKRKRTSDRSTLTRR